MKKFLVILGYSIIYLFYAMLWFPVPISDFMLPTVKNTDDILWLMMFILFVILLLIIYIFPKILFTIIAQKCRTYRARCLVMAIPLFFMFNFAISHKNNGISRNILVSPPMCYDPDEPVCMHLPPLAERWHEFFAYDCVQILFYILFTLIYFHVADQKKKKNLL